LTGNALISVYDKSRLEHIVGAFARHKIKIISSGGTAQAIRKLRHEVVEVSAYTGFPEMPGGLVKTLHPRIHAGILGDWNDPTQLKYLQENGIEPVDFVVVNLYPFQDVVKSDPVNLLRAVDNIDIGGVALVRAAAKGAFLNNRVAPLTRPAQYDVLIRELDKNGAVPDALKHKLAREAFAVTAEYDAAIESYLGKVKG
jgi:phosphoribosylaminoimidazolecarboxamide formyltransferase / IMP cyclohydrolase